MVWNLMTNDELLAACRAYDETQDLDDNRPFWSGDRPPPPIGTKVRLVLHGWLGKTGTVHSYTVRDGWLGVWVVVDQELPAWFTPTGNGQHIDLFGRDIEYP